MPFKWVKDAELPGGALNHEYHPFILSLIKNYDQKIYLEYYNNYFNELDTQRRELERAAGYKTGSTINRSDDDIVESAMVYYSKLFTRALANYFCSISSAEINLIFNYAASAYAAYNVLQNREVIPYYPADMLGVIQFHASILSSST